MLGRAIFAASCLLLGACNLVPDSFSSFSLPPTYAARPSGPVEAGPVEIGPKTWAAYQEYLTVIGAKGRGVFAIAEDGASGSSWVCASDRCANVDQYGARAIARCEELNPGYRCLVFAVDRQPQIDFVQPN